MAGARSSSKAGLGATLAGPTGAHALRNETDDIVRVLMYSTVSPTAVSVYPDSDKLGVWVDNPDDKLILPRTSATDYYSGEL